MSANPQLLRAATGQIDDPDEAVAEILAQIAGEKNFKKNSVGIAFCHPEFVENGAIAELAAKLPFEIIGCTVASGGINARFGDELLSLAVITGDDLEIACAASAPLNKNNIAPMVEQCYQTARAKLNDEPKIIFALGPMSPGISGADIVGALDRSGGGAPVFGTLTCGISLTYEDTRVFCGGDIHRYKLALALIGGNFQPYFFTAALAPRNISKEKFRITKSDGYTITEINDTMSVMRCLDICQIASRQFSAAPTMLPMMIDYGDGSPPVAGTIYELSEAGAVCALPVPVGASLSFGTADQQSVLETAKTVVARYSKIPQIHGIINISCLARFYLQKMQPSGEFDLTDSMLGDSPQLFGYSGGEICPMYRYDGSLRNQFHNLTFSSLVF